GRHDEGGDEFGPNTQLHGGRGFSAALPKPSPGHLKTGEFAVARTSLLRPTPRKHAGHRRLVNRGKIGLARRYGDQQAFALVEIDEADRSGEAAGLLHI